MQERDRSTSTLRRHRQEGSAACERSSRLRGHPTRTRRSPSRQERHHIIAGDFGSGRTQPDLSRPTCRPPSQSHHPPRLRDRPPRPSRQALHPRSGTRSDLRVHPEDPPHSPQREQGRTWPPLCCSTVTHPRKSLAGRRAPPTPPADQCRPSPAVDVDGPTLLLYRPWHLRRPRFRLRSYTDGGTTTTRRPSLRR